MFFLRSIINKFDDVLLFENDIITIIKIRFLNDVKTKIFENFNMLIRIIFC